MPAPEKTLLIEGTFAELTGELVDYIDGLRKAKDESAAPLKDAVAPLLEKYAKAEESKDEETIDEARDQVLKPVVDASAALNASPEREFLAAYNLLFHLIHESDSVNRYLQPICRNLSSELQTPASPQNRTALALAALSTVFNILDPEDSVRYPIFNAILDVIRRAGAFDSIRNQLAQLDRWMQTWEVDEAQQRKMYMRVSQIARESGEDDVAYDYLVRALRTVPSEEVSSDEARKLSVEALKAALDSPTHFNFEDLTDLDSIQGLRTSDPVYFQLLEIFTSHNLDDYQGFKDEHKGWVEQQGLDDDNLTRKIRLLTLTSLAAQSGQTRSLPYKAIAESLQVQPEEVEMWVIDVIRAKLVEGKLSQLNQTFNIHRSTYRVFGDNQWREVAGRLDMWRTSLTNVLGVIRQEKEGMIVQKEQEARQLEAKVNGHGGGGGGGGRRNNRNFADAVDLGMD